MKILISAYYCEPGKGSEWGIGWSLVEHMARCHDVWVLTQSHERQCAIAVSAKENIPNARFVFVDLPSWARFLKPGGGWQGQLRYYMWQSIAYMAARSLNKKHGFRLVHHITMGRYWTPSFLALLPVPFVWGPVGGGESAPNAFKRSFSVRGRLYELVRDFTRRLSEYDPFLRSTARRSAVGFATTEETADRMRRLGCRQVSVLSAIALSRDEIHQLSSLVPRRDSPFRLISIGRLLHWKGFHLSIEAFAQFHQQFPDSEYWIVGDGPERDRLRELARLLGVAEKITFWGSTSRSLVLEKLAAADVLIHPSLHDSGGWVCIEAMAAGRPVICLDLGGPGTQITSDTGIKVNASSPEQATNQLAIAILRLASDPAQRLEMGFQSRQRVCDHFSWDPKAELLNRVYHELAHGPSRHRLTSNVSPCSPVLSEALLDTNQNLDPTNTFPL